MLSAFSTPLFFNGTKTERVKICDPLSIMCTHISVSADVKSVISCFQGRVDLQRVPCFFKPCLFKKKTLRRKKQASLRLVNGTSIKKLHKHNNVPTQPLSQSHFPQIHFSHLLLAVLMQLILQIKTERRAELRGCYAEVNPKHENI